MFSMAQITERELYILRILAERRRATIQAVREAAERQCKQVDEALLEAAKRRAADLEALGSSWYRK